ncbi:MAG: S41 family peptidase [Bacteroidales bacterium]|nr:S41 family peptidase [Bacteroidales bacterium]
MNNKPKNYNRFLPIIFALLLISGMVLGFLLERKLNSTGMSSVLSGAKGYHKVDDIINFIDDNYVDSVNNNHLESDAIKGMLNDLDPHSMYISADEFNEINDPLLGSFEGIGVSFRIEKDTVMVVEAIPGGPSEKVGIMAGDRIVKVNDTLIAGKNITNNEVIHKLKGPKGTKVKVSVFRRGVPKLIDFTITRGIIPMYSLDIAYMVNKHLGYIKLNKFSATTYEEFDKAVKKLQSEGMKDLILDLRGNPGGYLNAAIDVADEFLQKGKLIVYTKGLHRPPTYAFATSKGRLKNTDVGVLIDEGTASAAEIVTGALQDNDRGIIIGRRSFGKGLVQEQVRMPDGSALRLTVARYYTPTGRCIQKPYKKDDFQDYYMEAYRRSTDGELTSKDSIHFNDSLKYETPKGKIVYGGGGIMPDVFIPVEIDTLHSYYNVLANKGLIYQFAFDYTDAHRAQLVKYKDFKSFDKGFNMTDAEYKKLVAYAASKGIHMSPEKVKVSQKKISVLFKAYVGRNILNEKGFYPIYHEIDHMFKKAVNIMNKRYDEPKK